MSKRSAELLINDIIDCGRKILIYTEGFSLDVFEKDNKTVDAVIRNFQIIGEAANRLPDEFKDKYPEIDWYRIRGLRNRVVHDYFGIDYSIIWQIKENYLPQMIEKLEALSI
jgi:uncharacterized protein with HEPN domain